MHLAFARRPRALSSVFGAAISAASARRAAASTLMPSAALFSTQSAATVQVASAGAPGAPLFFADERATPVSPWHELPLREGSGGDGEAVVNFVLEAPRGAAGVARCRLAVARAFTPLVWEAASNVGAAGALPLPPLARMGFLPQTWEDPAVADALTGLPGDGRPLDVAEIGEAGKPAVRRCEGGRAREEKELGFLEWDI